VTPDDRAVITAARGRGRRPLARPIGRPALSGVLAAGLLTALAACGGGSGAPAAGGTAATSAAAAQPTTAAPASTTPAVSSSPDHRPARRPAKPRPTATTHRATSAPPVTHTAAPTTTPPRPTATSRPTTHPSTHPSTHPTVPITTSPPPPSGSGRDYRFPVAGCRVNYGSAHHDYPATDIFADKGCAFVAVVSGTVDEVSYRDTWSSKVNSGASRGGLSLSIVGSDGVRYYGSHLSAIASGIAPGVHVRAGQLLGRVGNTGDARYVATHVHFGISWPTRSGVWWVRRGEVSPYTYLNSWRAGGNLSPHAAVAREHSRQGDVPPCRIDC